MMIKNSTKNDTGTTNHNNNNSSNNDGNSFPDPAGLQAGGTQQLHATGCQLVLHKDHPGKKSLDRLRQQQEQAGAAGTAGEEGQELEGLKWVVTWLGTSQTVFCPAPEGCHIPSSGMMYAGCVCGRHSPV